MLEAKLEQASLLKRVIEAISEMMSDCNFDCSEQGISLQALDATHVSLISLLLGSDSFSEYRSDRSLTLGVNINSLSKILKCGNNDDILTLRAEDKPSTLSLTFEDPKQDKISAFNLKLMNIDQEHMTIPVNEYGCSVTMPTSEFQRICRDLRAVSDSLRIDVSKDGVRFVSKGDIGDGSVTIKPSENLDDKDSSVRINVSEPASLNFNLKYLIDICKGGSLSNTVTLNMSTDLPLEVEYKLPNGYLKYYLAPKIEEGDGGDEDDE